jgi:hypothetical protein
LPSKTRIKVGVDEEEDVSSYRMTLRKRIKQSGPVTGLEWPREFQEVKVPRFHDNGTGWW